MPSNTKNRRDSKGARLWLRTRKGRKSVYWIRDTGQPDKSTGTADLREAEAALAEYISERNRGRSGPADPAEITVAEVLTIYAEEKAMQMAKPERLAYAIDALVPFWGDRTLDTVRQATCTLYQRERQSPRLASQRPVKPSTVRRELGVLRAAITHCWREGYITRAPGVSMPPPATPKRRWLTTNEAARLLQAARAQRHVARFILIGLYTGTRKDAILGLGWKPHATGGWIDLENGVLHRKSDSETETNKRRPPVRMPSKLLAHAKRWHQDGEDWVCHFKGNRVKDIKTSWRKTAARAGLSDVTPHTLKHTSVTWMMQAGIPFADQAVFFGTSMQELMRTYGHHNPAHQFDAARALDRRRN